MKSKNLNPTIDIKSHRRIYNIWKKMNQRCININCQEYKNYGGRGISVCSQWTIFDNFRTWALNNNYCNDLMLDRKDNNGNYEPDNCRWVDRLVQNNNQRSNVKITAWGETKNIAEWSRDQRCKVTKGGLENRFKRKTFSTNEECISNPIRQSRKNLSITAFGITKSISEWERDERCKITKSSIYWRLEHNYYDSFEQLLTEPLKRNQYV